mgnify:FL=1
MLVPRSKYLKQLDDLSVAMEDLGQKTIADVNRKLTGIETFILFTEPEHTHISSSIVRELLRYGKDISQFVPKETRLY